MKKVIVLSLATVAVLSSTGCAPRIGGNDYAVVSTGQVSDTFPGVIASKRVVRISAKTPEHQNDPGLGAGAGALAGAGAGSYVGKGSGSLWAMGAGALAGGIGGHFAEKALTDQDGFEYTVRLEDGRLMTVAQGAEPNMGVGQHVLVIVPQVPRGQTTLNFGANSTNSARARVVPDGSR